jgi:hypothetical protein
MNASPFAFRDIALALVLLSIASQPLCAQHPLALWARRDVAGVTANFRGVAFGNGTFVAVGSSSTVATSADGTIWSTSTIGSYGDLLQVRFLNGQFVAVGSSDKILISDDGTSWTAGTFAQFRILGCSLWQWNVCGGWHQRLRFDKWCRLEVNATAHHHCFSANDEKRNT